jgi:hypothetical protein
MLSLNYSLQIICISFLLATACTPIQNSVGPVTCNNLNDTQGDITGGFECNDGYFLVKNARQAVNSTRRLADRCRRM